jgi:hypothetical protein
MRRNPALLLVMAALSSCGTGDSGSSDSPSSALVAFQSSACKKEALSSQALTAQEAEAGLKCIRWQPLDGGTLRLELINFEGACGAHWTGRVEKSESGLELWAANPSCMIAACGWCIYDWAFDIEGVTGTDLSVSIITDPCPGEQTPDQVTATLPLSKSPAGELCRYAHHGALSWQASALGTCGQAYMPCRSADGMCALGTASTACEGGLVCGDAGEVGQQVCHAPCTGDCGPTGSLSCQNGLCRPANPW